MENLDNEMRKWKVKAIMKWEAFRWCCVELCNVKLLISVNEHNYKYIIWTAQPLVLAEEYNIICMYVLQHASA